MLDQTQNKIDYIISEANLYYPFPYALYNPEEDIRVFVRDEEAGTTEELLSGFSVPVQSSYSDGCVVKLDASTACEKQGKTLVIIRSLKLRQTLSLPIYGKLSPVEMEHALDRLVMVAQQLQEQVSRSMQVPIGDKTDMGKAYSDFRNVAENAESWAERAEKSASSAWDSASKAQTEASRVDAVASQIHSLEIGSVQAGESPAVTLRDGHILDFTLQKGPKGDDGGTVVVPTKWGAITGTLSDQSDLASVLASKADASHDHDDTYVKKGEIPSGTEGTVPWGAITGSLADQIDLSAAIEAKADAEQVQSALDSKANSSHSHVIEDVAGIASVLASKANSSHSHSISDISTLQSSLEGKAAKSHTHVSSDITDLQTGGGVEEFSDASKEWSASDIGKIFIYKGLTQGKFINGRLYHCLKYTHVISSGASEAYLMLTLSQTTSDTFVNALAGRYDLTSGTVGTTNAVYTNSNGAEVYYNSTTSRWAIRYQTSIEAFIMQSGGPEGDYQCWDYETSVSITATKYETAGGDPVTEDRYCAVIIDTSPLPIIESTGDLTVYPGISYKLNLSGDVTLSADGGVEGMSGECEIYISTSTYSVTAGTNITFVDTLFSNTTNHCVIKWDGESAKLYVCEVR